MTADETTTGTTAIRSRGRDIAPTAEQLDEARGWVSDCTWKESELYDIDPGEDFTDEEIVRGVDRHFDGGWDEFLVCGGFKDREPQPESDQEVGS